MTPRLCDSSATSEGSCESITRGHGVLRKVDAAWLFEIAPDAMILVNRVGQITSLNARAEEMFGYRREELIGQPADRLMPKGFGHDSQADAELPARALKPGSELFGLRKDGSLFPISIRLSQLETPEGLLIASAIREISPPMRDDELGSRLEFEKLISRLSTAFINVPENRIEDEVNKGLEDLAEVLDLDRVTITFSGAVVHSWTRLGLPPAHRSENSEMFQWTARGFESHGICCISSVEDLPEGAFAERRYMLSEGVKSWLTIPLVVGGESLGAMGIALLRKQRKWDAFLIVRLQQVAEVFANGLARKHTAEVLRESQEQTQLALDSAKLGVGGWRSGRDELWASEQTRELFAWQPDAKLDFTTCLDAVYPEDRTRIQCLIEQAMAEPQEYQVEFRVLRPDGSVRWIKSQGRSYAGVKGTSDRFLGASMDITDRKISEQALADQLAFATLLAELSATFINLPAEQVDDQIEIAQRRICEQLGLDRSTVIQVSPSGDEIVSSHSWAAEGFESFPLLSMQYLPWAARTVLGGQAVSFARIDDLPPEAAQDKDFLRLHGPKSNVAFPLSTGGMVIGALGFGTLREEREWPAPLVERLRLVAEIFANAIARKRASQDLRTAYSHIQQLKQQLESENLYLREEIKLEQVHHEVVGGSEGIRRVLKNAEQVAKTDATVLLLGATGTGKELIARAIHESSNRRHRPMVKVNCAALPATLIESELFGRERGAYTGALTREMGRFELANGSTIFLDEIGELPLELQAKLLRVLQEGEFERLGSPKTIHVDVRVIAATSRDLEAAIKESRFREDLFYRLNVFPITIPPLSERREDIPQLVWHFLNELGPRMGRHMESVHGPTMEAFTNYAWPGNIRELRNVVERLLITSSGTVLRSDWQPIAKAEPASHGQTLAEVERQHILHVLESARWHIRGKGGAAEILGMKATTLESRMQRLGISRPG
jgi:formate hydrogenlyase transcriptional activator